jgi:hypothetical protein
MRRGPCFSCRGGCCSLVAGPCAWAEVVVGDLRVLCAGGFGAPSDMPVEQLRRVAIDLLVKRGCNAFSIETLSRHGDALELAELLK